MPKNLLAKALKEVKERPMSRNTIQFLANLIIEGACRELPGCTPSPRAAAETLVRMGRLKRARWGYVEVKNQRKKSGKNQAKNKQKPSRGGYFSRQLARIVRLKPRSREETEFLLAYQASLHEGENTPIYAHDLSGKTNRSKNGCPKRPKRQKPGKK